MKAVQINSYGTNDVLEINDTPKPSLKQGQVLVEVHGASINPVDWKIRAGYMKDMASLNFPATLGGDFAGVVTEAGPPAPIQSEPAGGEVSEFKTRDEVFGSAIVLNGGSGSFAQFLTSNVINTAHKPKTINFEQAAALPLVGSSAVQALEEHIKLQSGQKILIHGGAGGIGHMAIQLAKALGAYVATTVNTEDVDFAKNLGADEVIDYKTQNFEEILKDFDAVFDTVGGKITDASFKILRKGGIIVSMVGQPNEDLAKQHQVTAIGQGTNTNTSHLRRVAELVDARKLKVEIDKVFPLEQIKEAFKYQEETHPRGKVVVRIKETK